MPERLSPVKRNVLHIAFPFVATLGTLTAGCGPDLNWKTEATYEDCGFVDKDIPVDHKVIIQKSTKLWTPDRYVLLEDLGKNSECVDRLTQAQQARK